MSFLNQVGGALKTDIIPGPHTLTLGQGLIIVGIGVIAAEVAKSVWKNLTGSR